MGGVAGEEEAAVLHRLRDHAPHRGDAGLDDLARLELGLGKTKAKLVPNSRLRPGVYGVVGVDLEIEPADLGRSHAVQGEAAVVGRVDELV